MPTNVNGFKYKFNGTEYQDEFDLNMYDLGARMYDPALGRMSVIDPRTEEYDFQSPYVIANNNPVFYIDFNGEGVDTDFKIDKKTGTTTRVDPNDGSEARSDDRLFATDDEGNVDSTKSPLVIDKADPSDNTVISDLANNEKVVKKDLDGKPINVSFAQTKSGSDAAALFKFASDNTNVEFGLGERKGTFTVTTSGLPTQLFRPSQIGLGKQRRFVHTHDKSVNPSVNDKKNTTYQNFLYVRKTKRLVRFDKKGKFGKNRKGTKVKSAEDLKNKLLKIRHRNN